MLTHITHYIVIVAVSSHGLLCGNVCCCAMTSSAKNDVSSHSFPYPWHLEKPGGTALESRNTQDQGSKHCCNCRHHFCHCVQSPAPNKNADFRVNLSKNLLSIPVAFLSAIILFPSHDLNHRINETRGVSLVSGIRLHLFLEHLLN